MEAHIFRAITLCAAVLAMGATYQTPNFVVTAPSQEFAVQVGQAAEQYRRDLALLWLGHELPRWGEACPIFLQVGPTLGAGGATSFVFDRGEVFNWHMTIQGTPQRILDSVLPHEVTHTIFASHFRRPLPRWADEGACTTVEHESERRKQQQMLVQFLQTNRGIAFGQMFAMRDYPADVMPLYSQGYSLCRFLIQQGGRKRFIGYIGEGMRSGQWGAVTKSYYGYNNLSELQTAWVDWVRRGSPILDSPDEAPRPDANVLVSAQERPRPESDVIYRAQSSDQQTKPPRTTNAGGGPEPRPAPESLASKLPPPVSNDQGWRPAGKSFQAGDSIHAYPRDDKTLPAGGISNNSVAAIAPASNVAPPKRQVLLEWSRDSNAAAETGPQAAAIARQAAVLDASRPGNTILR